MRITSEFSDTLIYVKKKYYVTGFTNIYFKNNNYIFQKKYKEE